MTEAEKKLQYREKSRNESAIPIRVSIQGSWESEDCMPTFELIPLPAR